MEFRKERSLHFMIWNAFECKPFQPARLSSSWVARFRFARESMKSLLKVANNEEEEGSLYLSALAHCDLLALNGLQLFSKVSAVPPSAPFSHTLFVSCFLFSTFIPPSAPPPQPGTAKQANAEKAHSHVPLIFFSCPRKPLKKRREPPLSKRSLKQTRHGAGTFQGAAAGRRR